MPDASRYKRLEPPAGPSVDLDIEGRAVTAPVGETVAATMLAEGFAAFRETPVSDTPRGPFCMMGACFDCLVEIDGVPNRQACMTQVAEGMRVRTMRGARAVGKGGSDAA